MRGISPGAHASRALAHSDIIPARTTQEAEFAAEQISGEIKLVAAQDSSGLGALERTADANVLRPAYTTTVVTSHLFLGQVAQASRAPSEALSQYFRSAARGV